MPVETIEPVKIEQLEFNKDLVSLVNRILDQNQQIIEQNNRLLEVNNRLLSAFEFPRFRTSNLANEDLRKFFGK